MKRRLAPELATAVISSQLDFLPVPYERRYYLKSSLAANFHRPSKQASLWQPFLSFVTTFT